MKKSTTLILQLLSLSLVGILAFAMGWQQNELAQTAAANQENEAILRLRQTPPIEVATMKLQPRVFQEKLELTGRVIPWRSAQLTFQEAGQVNSLKVDKGDEVQGPDKKDPGQELAAIDGERIEAILDSVRAARDQAKWDLDQVRDLHKQGSASEQQLRQAGWLFDMRNAEMRQAARSFRDTRLRAPFSGTIAERHIELGESVSPQQPAFRLVDQSRVKVMVYVPGRQIGDIKKGQPAEIELHSNKTGSATLKGHVFHIPSTAKELLFAVEIEVDNKTGKLREGMIVKVAIHSKQTEPVYVLPLGTVIQKGDKRFVMLLRQDYPIQDGHYDLGLLPDEVRNSLPTEPGFKNEKKWQRLTTEQWQKLEIAARFRLTAKITDQDAHTLLGPGIIVFHLGPAARVIQLTQSRIVGEQCLVPLQGTFSPGDLLIARGQYQATDGHEVRVGSRNELGLPGKAGH